MQFTVKYLTNSYGPIQATGIIGVNSGTAPNTYTRYPLIEGGQTGNGTGGFIFISTALDGVWGNLFPGGTGNLIPNLPYNFQIVQYYNTVSVYIQGPNGFSYFNQIPSPNQTGTRYLKMCDWLSINGFVSGMFSVQNFKYWADGTEIIPTNTPTGGGGLGIYNFSNVTLTSEGFTSPAYSTVTVQLVTPSGYAYPSFSSFVLNANNVPNGMSINTATNGSYTGLLCKSSVDTNYNNITSTTNSIGTVNMNPNILYQIFSSVRSPCNIWGAPMLLNVVYPGIVTNIDWGSSIGGSYNNHSLYENNTTYIAWNPINADPAVSAGLTYTIYSNASPPIAPSSQSPGGTAIVTALPNTTTNYKVTCANGAQTYYVGTVYTDPVFGYSYYSSGLSKVKFTYGSTLITSYCNGFYLGTPNTTGVLTANVQGGGGGGGGAVNQWDWCASSGGGGGFVFVQNWRGLVTGDTVVVNGPGGGGGGAYADNTNDVYGGNGGKRGDGNYTAGTVNYKIEHNVTTPQNPTAYPGGGGGGGSCWGNVAGAYLNAAGGGGGMSQLYVYAPSNLKLLIIGGGGGGGSAYSDYSDYRGVGGTSRGGDGGTDPYWLSAAPGDSQPFNAPDGGGTGGSPYFDPHGYSYDVAIYSSGAKGQPSGYWFNGASYKLWAGGNSGWSAVGGTNSYGYGGYGNSGSGSFPHNAGNGGDGYIEAYIYYITSN